MAGEQDSGTKRGIIAVIGGIMIHLIIGTVYLWGNVSLYVASYLRVNGNPTLTRNTVQAVLPFLMTAIGLFVPFGVKIGHTLGFRKTCYIAGCIMPGCVFLASFIQSFALFCLVYGFITGIPSGCVYMIPMINGFNHFPSRKGMISGMIVGGFGLGSFIFSFIVFGLVNPDNIHPISDVLSSEYGFFPEAVTTLWPGTLRTIAVIYFCFFMTGTTLMLEPTEEQKKISHEKHEEAVKKKYGDRQFPQSFAQGIRHHMTFLLCFITICTASFGVVLVAGFKSFGMLHEALADDNFLTIVGALAAVFNCCGRLFWGNMMDRVQFRYLILTNLSIQWFVSVMLQYVTGSRALYLIFVLIEFSCYGGGFALMPALTKQLFGENEVVYGYIYGCVFQGFSVAAWIQFFAVQSIKSWENIFMLYTAIITVGLLTALFSKWEVDWNAVLKNQPVVKTKDDMKAPLNNKNDTELGNFNN